MPVPTITVKSIKTDWKIQINFSRELIVLSFGDKPLDYSLFLDIIVRSSEDDSMIFGSYIPKQEFEESPPDESQKGRQVQEEAQSAIDVDWELLEAKTKDCLDQCMALQK